MLQQDEVLTADTAGIADADGVGTLAYQWLADGTPISGATSSTYTLTATEVTDAISLRVTFTDDQGYSESPDQRRDPRRRRHRRHAQAALAGNAHARGPR